MIPGLAEYVLARLVRRHLFGAGFLARFGHYLPHYRANANQANPGPVVDAYAEGLARLGVPDRRAPNILEIGSGATNSVGYELLRRGFAGDEGRICLYEPLIRFDPALDMQMRRRMISPATAERAVRVTSLAGIADGTVDVVLSNSVLEHVTDMEGLLACLIPKMRASGVMVHAVDYRDHFFKYPYHFLLFRDATWQRWLDPGDLPRWRLGDHLKAFRARGLAAEVLSSESEPAEFARVRAHLAPRFDRDDPETAVTRAVIACRLHSTIPHP